MSYIDQDIQQWPTLPADKMVPGFAAGMDDLAQIVLNNKFKTKFNRNALTLPGAEDWVAKKNRTIKDPSKYWVAGLGDLNKDGVKEVLIKDGMPWNVRFQVRHWKIPYLRYTRRVPCLRVPLFRLQRHCAGIWRSAQWL